MCCPFRKAPLGVGLLLLAATTGSTGLRAQTQLANLASYGYVSVASPSGAAPPVFVPALASATNAAPVALVQGNVLLLQWTQPRAVRQIRLKLQDPLPAASALQVEWWHDLWPDNVRNGRRQLDDPFHGAWVAAHGTASLTNHTLRFRFDPLTAGEVPGVQHTGMVDRLTYALRLSFPNMVTLAHVAAFSDAVLRRAELRFEWGQHTTVPGQWSPKFSAHDGRILAVRRQGRHTAFVTVEYADTAQPLSADRGSVAFHSGETRSFSVNVDDVLRAGGLFVRDIGVFVSDARKHLTYANWHGPQGDAGTNGTVIDQVAHRPEQSWAQARQAWPALPPPALQLGVPHLRQQYTLLPQGQIELRADALHSPGPDVQLRPWPWKTLVYDFNSGQHPVMGPHGNRSVKRSLEDGWLPCVHYAWQTGPLEYTETCVTAPLVDDIAQLQSQSGTEPTVLAVRFTIKNTATSAQPAWLWLELSRTQPLLLTLDNTLLLNHPSDGIDRDGFVPVRGRFNTMGKGQLDLGVLVPSGPGSFNPDFRGSRAAREAVRYRVHLGPGESHTVEFFVPYLELLDANQIKALKALSFAKIHDAVVHYWKQRVDRGMTYEVPEPWLNHFFKANLWHVLLAAKLDPATGLTELESASASARNDLYATAVVAQSLEQRGEHRTALQLLRPFLMGQGVQPLPGNFRTKDGLLYAAYLKQPNSYTAVGNSLDPGFGMRALAVHYLWTHETSYLLRVAPQLVNAADWVTYERQATMYQAPDGGRPLEYGLLPAGTLDAAHDFHYYYAADTAAYAGMKKVGEVLADAVPLAPEKVPTTNTNDALSRQALRAAAKRIAHDTTAFGRDIRTSIAKAVAASPVVRLRDGTWIPYVPPRVYGRLAGVEGWRGLYPPLPPIGGGVFGIRHPFVDWMLDELEDNTLLSAANGASATQARTNVFDLGGATRGPTLLNLAPLFLARGQVRNFLRTFYNTAAANLAPDAAGFVATKSSSKSGTSSRYRIAKECSFVQWMRDMLVFEQGDTLELGLGVPRAWMADGQHLRVQRAATRFGPVDLSIRSDVANDQILATVNLTPTTRPHAIWLRLRHPAGKLIRSVVVNGHRGKVNASRQLIELPVRKSHWEIIARF